MELFLHYTIFVAACFWVALEPGPGFVKLSSNTIKLGRTGGILTATGMHMGALPAILITGFGLDTLVQSSAWFLTVMKILGAFYLIWLGLGMLRSTDNQNVESTNEKQSHSSMNKKLQIQLLAEGFTLVATNPRTYLFYPAFLVFFTPELLSYGLATQLLLMGFTTASIFLLVDIIFVLGVSKLRYSHRITKSLSKIGKYLGGGILLAFGTRLLFDTDE